MKQSGRLILCGGMFCKLKCSLTEDLCLKSADFSEALCCTILSWIRNGHLGFLYCLMGRSINKKGQFSKPQFAETTWGTCCKFLIPLNILLRWCKLRFIMNLEVQIISNRASMMNIFKFVKYIWLYRHGIVLHLPKVNKNSDLFLVPGKFLHLSAHHLGCWMCFHA